MIRVARTALAEENRSVYENLVSHVLYGVNLDPTWIDTFVKTFGYEGREYLLEIRETTSDVQLGLLPLVRKDDRASRFVTHRRLVPAGYGPTDFFDIPILPGREAEVTKAIVDWLVRHRSEWDELMLNLVPRETVAWQFLVRNLEERGLKPRVTSDRNFLRLDTSGSYDDYLRELGNEKVKELRYYRNRLKKEGRRLEVEHVRSGSIEYFERFVEMYGQRRTAKLQSDPYRRVGPLFEFMKTIIPQYEKRGWVRLSLLKLDDEIVACCYNFVHRNVMYYSMPAFADMYKQYSPGRLLLMDLIKGAFEDKSIREFNFMRSEYSYKHWFMPSIAPYVSVSCTNPRSYRNKVLGAIGVYRTLRSRIFGPKMAPPPAQEVIATSVAATT